ncbi:lipocalin-like domain-containing protein [Streptomyces sp. NPDC058653]|uniref:lipocalin-like domain-containing protein n=1 Tax=Streptomyces sp. NPDC058653 TaxID=3346576 RepID=UPI0036497F45
MAADAVHCQVHRKPRNHPAPRPADAATGYLAYSGKYTVDESARTLHHDLEVSLLPSWLGTIQIREVTFDCDQLILAADDAFPLRQRCTPFWSGNGRPLAGRWQSELYGCPARSGAGVHTCRS